VKKKKKKKKKNKKKKQKNKGWKKILNFEQWILKNYIKKKIKKKKTL
jgi:hypothetical protein